MFIHIRLVCSSWRWNLPWEFESTWTFVPRFWGKTWNGSELISLPEKEVVPSFDENI